MPNEFEILFKETYRNDKLTYFRLPATKHEIKIYDHKIKFGEASVIRSGRDITLIAAGPQLKNVVKSIPSLINAGIDPEIIYLPTIKPFDYHTVGKSIKKTSKYLVIEEHMEFGGIGDEVLRCTENVLLKDRIFINIPNKYIHNYGSYLEICQDLGFTPENIVRKVKAIF